jgi:lipoprotein NlpI
MRAAQKGTEYERRTQLCEASFYLGEEALLRGNRDEAARLFRQAATVGVTHLYEHQGAMVELQRLGL